MHTMPKYNQSEAQTTINFSQECQAVKDMASHQALFGARLDSIEHKASEPEATQLEVEFPTIENAIHQVTGEKNTLAKLDQQSMEAIYQRLAELEMFLMIGSVELVEIPLQSK